MPSTGKGASDAGHEASLVSIDDSDDLHGMDETNNGTEGAHSDDTKDGSSRPSSDCLRASEQLVELTAVSSRGSRPDATARDADEQPVAGFARCDLRFLAIAGSDVWRLFLVDRDELESVAYEDDDGDDDDDEDDLTR